MPKLIAETREKLADLQTPVTAFLRLCRGQKDSFLLESVEPHESIGRYSIIAYDPLETVELWPDRIDIAAPGGPRREDPSRFFDLIRETLAARAVEPAPALPAVGSLMGFVGYDAVRLIERLGPAPASDLPTARLAFCSRYVVFDHLRRVMTLIGLSRDRDQARAKVDDMAALLEETERPRSEPAEIRIQPPSRRAYMEAVGRAKEHIAAGDIFQVVLADRFVGQGRVDPLPGLPTAPGKKSLALHVLPGLRIVPDGGGLARDPGQGAGRQGPAPAHRRNPRPVRRPGRGRPVRTGASGL